MSDHLTPKEFFEFIRPGRQSGTSGTASYLLHQVSVRAGLSVAGRGTRNARGGRSWMTFTSNSNDTARPDVEVATSGCTQ